MFVVKLIEGKTLQPFQQRIVDEYNEVESVLLALESRLKKLTDHIIRRKDPYEEFDMKEVFLLRLQRIEMVKARRCLIRYLDFLAMRMKHQGFATCERKGA